MTVTTTNQSPIHELLDARGAEWWQIAGGSVAVRFEDDETERAAMRGLGLCDLSGLPKLGVKGPRAADWLSEQQIKVPPEVYGVYRTADDGLVVRFARDEFLLEGGIGHDFVGPLAAKLQAGVEGVYRVERQEATFLLVGSRAVKVLAQTCGINFQETPTDRVLFTRIAGVSCGIVPETIGAAEVYRIWVDYTYAQYLWETLVEISDSLSGRVIGAGCLYPELK